MNTLKENANEIIESEMKQEKRKKKKNIVFSSKKKSFVINLKVFAFK